MGGACGTYGGKELTSFLGGEPREEHFKDIGADGKIILEWIFKKSDGKSWTGLIWLRIRIGGGTL